jgi:hypothetical protein
LPISSLSSVCLINVLSFLSLCFSHRNLDLECACWRKWANFFQLVSTLFCEVKRGFVNCRKIVPL